MVKWYDWFFCPTAECGQMSAIRTDCPACAAEMLPFDELLIDDVIYIVRELSITNLIYYKFVAKEDLDRWVRSAVFQSKAKGII